MITCPGYSDNSAQTTWTYNSTSWTSANGGSGNSLSFISNGEDEVSYFTKGLHSTEDEVPMIGIGIDTTATAIASTWGNINDMGTVFYTRLEAEGQHVAYMIVTSVSAGVVTMYADDSRRGGTTDPYVTYLTAIVKG